MADCSGLSMPPPLGEKKPSMLRCQPPGQLPYPPDCTMAPDAVCATFVCPACDGEFNVRGGVPAM